MYGARPVYTHHARNFVFLPNSRIGQAPMQPASPGQIAPAQIAPGQMPPLPPVRADETPIEPRVQIAWGPLILAGIAGGAAFALGAGLINRFVFDK